MLESLSACPGPNYSHIIHSPEGLSSIAPQLNCITDIILELKAELAKIKTELKELKNRLTVFYLSLINEVRHSERDTSSISTLFQHEYPFQNPKKRFHFLCKK